MSIKDRHRSITVRGLVCPSDWDDDDVPCRVSILTFDDDEFEVEPTDAGRYLLDHIGHEVMIRGHLSSTHRRRKVVFVKSFTAYDSGTVETVEGDTESLAADSAQHRSL